MAVGLSTRYRAKSKPKPLSTFKSACACKRLISERAGSALMQPMQHSCVSVPPHAMLKLCKVNRSVVVRRVITTVFYSPAKA